MFDEHSKQFLGAGVTAVIGYEGSVGMGYIDPDEKRLSAFLFNRENLYGKQFGDARCVWFYIQNNTFNIISGNAFIRFGKEINRLGVDGDPNNPFEIVPSLSYNFQLTFKPLVKLDNTLAYQYFGLTTERTGQKVR